MSTLGAILITVGAFALLSVAVSIIIAIQTFKNRIIATDEITHIRFYQEVVLIFISLFFLLIPLLVGSGIRWVLERDMRRKTNFNFEVMKCCIQSNIGSWTLVKTSQLRLWYNVESFLRRNRWRIDVPS